MFLFPLLLKFKISTQQVWPTHVIILSEEVVVRALRNLPMATEILKLSKLSKSLLSYVLI